MRTKFLLPSVVAVVLLVLMHPSTVRAAGSGGTVYVDSNGGNVVLQFDAATSGALSAKTPPSVPGGTVPQGLAVSPDGTHVYVAANQDNTIREYAVNGDGTLTFVTTYSTGPGSPNPYYVVITPDGKYLYASNFANNNIAEFSIESDGTLAALGAADGGGAVAGPSRLTISPRGGFLYVINANQTISTFLIPSTGALSYEGSTSPGSMIPLDIVFNPAGTFAYVSDIGNAAIELYTVGINGLLTNMIATGTGALTAPVGLLMNPTGTTLYVADNAGSVFTFAVNANTGQLNSGTSLPAGSNPQNLAFSANSKSLYITDLSANEVWQFAVGTGGALSPQSPASVTGGTAPLVGVSALPQQAPHALFTSSVATGTMNVVFDASNSSASDGTIAQYAWNFGDGTTATTSTPTTEHRYAAAGNFTITLTVTDSNGCSTTQVFDGKAVLCNGTSAAQVSATVAVATVPVPDTGANLRQFSPAGPIAIVVGAMSMMAGVCKRRRWRPR